MMDLKLQVGGCEVVASGTVVGNPQQPIEIELQNLHLRLDFETDKENKEQRVSITTLTSTELQLKYINFNNPTGTGNKNPIHLGTLGGKELYFNYRIYALNDEVGKSVQYTFYLKEKEVQQ